MYVLTSTILLLEIWFESHIYITRIMWFKSYNSWLDHTYGFSYVHVSWLKSLNILTQIIQLDFDSNHTPLFIHFCVRSLAHIKAFHSKPLRMLENIHLHYWFEISQHTSSLIFKKGFQSVLSVLQMNDFICYLILFPFLCGSKSSLLRFVIVMEILLLWLMLLWRFLENLEVYKLCVGVIGFDKSGGKELGYSLHNYFGNVMWKPTDKVGVIMNLQTDQSLRYP